MNTSTPVQYRMLGRMIKKFLHTKIGAYIGFTIGLSGFNSIQATITRNNGTIEKIRSFNSRVDVGAALCATLLSGTTVGGISAPSTAKYIALSTSSLTPAHTDTTLTGETSASGMGRALGAVGTYTAPVSLDGAASYILSKVFTASGTITIVSAAIFDAASTGNLYVEGNLGASASLFSGDQLTISWTNNL